MKVINIFLSCNDETKTIRWNRINCLNTLKDYTYIIDKNFHKFLWDIFKAITYFSLNGYCHNDVCIDNIGIRDGNFVLFDYNLSKQKKDEYTDIYKLFKSLQFHFNLPIAKNIIDIENFVLCLSWDKDMTVEETIQYLESLVILN